MNVIERRKMKKIPETMSRERKVQTAGYIPHKQRIEALMNAGLRLKEYRAEQFDVGPEDKNDPEIDPTRRKDYDLADAFQQGRAVRKSLEQQAKQKEAEIEESKRREEELKNRETGSKQAPE